MQRRNKLSIRQRLQISRIYLIPMNIFCRVRYFTYFIDNTDHLFRISDRISNGKVKQKRMFMIACFCDHWIASTALKRLHRPGLIARLLFYSEIDASTVFKRFGRKTDFSKIEGYLIHFVKTHLNSESEVWVVRDILEKISDTRFLEYVLKKAQDPTIARVAAERLDSVDSWVRMAKLETEGYPVVNCLNNVDDPARVLEVIQHHRDAQVLGRYDIGKICESQMEKFKSPDDLVALLEISDDTGLQKYAVEELASQRADSHLECLAQSESSYLEMMAIDALSDEGRQRDILAAKRAEVLAREENLETETIPLRYEDEAAFDSFLAGLRKLERDLRRAKEFLEDGEAKQMALFKHGIRIRELFDWANRLQNTVNFSDSERNILAHYWNTGADTAISAGDALTTTYHHKDRMLDVLANQASEEMNKRVNRVFASSE